MANSVEDYLIDGLSFKMKGGASYITDRRSVTYHPAGSNIYTPIATKLIKINVTGDHWLDPSTCRVMFDLVNLESETAKELRPLGNAWSFIKRVRCLVNGMVVEDISDYNRCHELFSIMQSEGTRKNDEVESFGRTWDHMNSISATEYYTEQNFSGVKGKQSQTVLFKPLLGILNQPKYLPLRYAPLTIELELVNDFKEPIIEINSVSVFTAENTSDKWQIQNVQFKADLVILDNSLENSYAQHLLSGKSLPINYSTIVSQIQSTLTTLDAGQPIIRLNITRALSRLKSVFLTLFGPESKITDNERNLYKGMKSWNNFYSPMRDYGAGSQLQYDENGEFECSLQLGAKRYPEYGIRSHAEAYYQLRKTLGLQSSKVHSFDIDFAAYRTWKFIVGIDMEKVLEAPFTGMNTRAGDILNVTFSHNSTEPTKYAKGCHIVLHCDCIMTIRDSGVDVDS